MASSSPTRATALASPLQQFAGWLLTVNCPGCRVLRMIAVATLIASKWWLDQHGRCGASHTCGNAPDWVRLADGIKGSARVVQEVMLVQDRP
jgi:hypothetical protein